MTNENTEIVLSHQEIDLNVEDKKQLRSSTVDFFKCAKKPTKDFADCVVDYLLNRLINWVDSKLSA